MNTSHAKGYVDIKTVLSVTQQLHEEIVLAKTPRGDNAWQLTASVTSCSNLLMISLATGEITPSDRELTAKNTG
jgi:hypothetical protein